MQQRVNCLTELTIDNHSCNLYTCTCSGGYPAEFPLVLTMERKRFKMLLKLIGTLSKDNADGDGNAIRSGKSQKVHCA